jgi:3-dehydroquinate dehydratase-2
MPRSYLLSTPPLAVIAAVGLPTVEVHVTNPSAREAFRTKAVVAGACTGVVSGFGWRSYLIAIDALVIALREAEPG